MRWKRLIENDKDIFSIIDFNNLSRKPNALSCIKIFSSGANVKKFCLTSDISTTDLIV